MGRGGRRGRAARVSVQRRLPEAPGGGAAAGVERRREPPWVTAAATRLPRWPGAADGARLPSEDWAGHVAASPTPASGTTRVSRAGRWAPHMPQTQHPPAGFLAPTRRRTSPPWALPAPPFHLGRNVPDPTAPADPAACGLTCGQLPRAHAVSAALIRPRAPRATPSTTTDRTPDLAPRRSQPRPVFPESLLPGRAPGAWGSPRMNERTSPVLPEK